MSSLPAYSQSFGYDGVNRLTSASDSGGGSQSYSYDANGNRWVNPGSFAPSGATPTPNVYDGQNRINGVSYDAAGNQLVVNGDTLTYDAENRQTSATESPALGGAQELYVYDGDGQRVEKIAPAGNTIYVYDAFGQLAAEYNTFATAPPCQTCYLSADLIGSTRMVTDASGTVVSRHDFLPFGEEIPATAGRGSPWAVADNVSEQFTGQVRDSGTGLDYFNARYFSGALGRFTSPDPENAGADLTNPESWNGYSYVTNNPVLMIDPSGLDPITFHVTASCGTGCLDPFIFGDFLGFHGNTHNVGAGVNEVIYHFSVTKTAKASSTAGHSAAAQRPKYVIQANQGTLVLEKVLPKACTISGTYHYSTGMNGNRDYTMAGQGPLPPGNYTLHPYEISPAGFFRKYLDPRDWGDFRVPLHPDPGTNTYGRSGFFLHGGYLRHGSEGCLKVEGSNQNNMFQQLQGAADPVPVQVTLP